MKQVMYVLPYCPEQLLDSLLDRLNLANDLALAIEIGISPSTVSKMRTGKSPVSAGFLVRASELTGERTRTLRAWMGDRRKFHRISSVYAVNDQAEFVEA